MWAANRTFDWTRGIKDNLDIKIHEEGELVKDLDFVGCDETDVLTRTYYLMINGKGERVVAN